MQPHLCVHGLTTTTEESALNGLLAVLQPTAAPASAEPVHSEFVTESPSRRSQGTRGAATAPAPGSRKKQRNSARGSAATEGKSVASKPQGVQRPVVPKSTCSPTYSPQPQDATFQADGASQDADDLPPLAELVHGKLLRPLTEVLHIESLTRIQKLSWTPMCDRKRDVLIRSETGSGKTLAYGLPLLHQLLCDCEVRPLQRHVGTLIVVLCPVRELVVQVTEVLTTLTRCAPFLTVGGIHGGENRHKEKARLRKGVPILITTPGRLLDHLKTTSSFRVSGVQSIVLDEADRLLDMGFEKAIREIMELLWEKSEASEERSGSGATKGHALKRILVSATITAAVERLSHFALRKSVARVGETEDTFSIPSSLRQHFVVVPTKHRLATLISFLRSQLDAGAKRVIVFVSTADSAEFHYYLLSQLKSPFTGRRRACGNRGAALQPSRRYSLKKRIEEANRHVQHGVGGTDEVVTFDDDDSELGEEQEEGHDTTHVLGEADTILDVHIFKLHGNMSQVDRASVFHAFKHVNEDKTRGSGKGVLFCTDVAARGLDMPNVDWIVHYDPPPDAPCYVHRIGRTARIGNVGDSLLFLMPHEAGYAPYLSNFIAKERRDALSGDAAAAMEEKKYESFLFYLTKLDPKANHMWMQSTAALERAICHLVMKRSPEGQARDHEGNERDDDLTRLALFAYQSYIRAYAGYSREMKRLFFNAEILHLGHVAQSFGVDKKPSELRTQLQSLIREDRKVGRETFANTERDRDGRPVKKLQVEVNHDDRYRSTVVQKQRKATRDWYEKKKTEQAPAPRPLQFTEFDA
ncbi:DEAD DEAH box helicase Type III restriction enzyme res subunit Helicase conserved C terminal domain [Trypanosoma vivax]|nr:DEAD DEAH box helicase Type III restriction enzyme res subunit Helicase conserved C terminal domain [Trypanosoma vivax]